MSIYEDNDPRSVIESGAFDRGSVLVAQVAAAVDPCIVGSHTVSTGVGNPANDEGFLIMAEFHHSQN